MNPECRLDSQGKQPRRTHEPSPRQPLTPHNAAARIRLRRSATAPLMRRRRFGWALYGLYTFTHGIFSPHRRRQRLHGRHDLPWQNTRDPYRIWLSEIMLQQTQVATVIPYYERFLARFPDVAALAAAAQEDVILPASLRARPQPAPLRTRNRARLAGRFAHGRSHRHPAGDRAHGAAIAAFAYGERSPILDGNVKRVFTRHFGIAGDPSKREVEQRLWALADTQVEVAPDLDMAAYTQGLMDLGATLCTRGKPACDKCPVADTCVARRAKAARPSCHAQGAQGGARARDGDAGAAMEWRLPAAAARARHLGGLEPARIRRGRRSRAASRALGLEPERHALAAFSHTFTHYRLHIRPWWVEVRSAALAARRRAGCRPMNWRPPRCRRR